jgi:N-acetylmuramoyl-L-alanine amidase
MSCSPTTRLESGTPISVTLKEAVPLLDGNRVLDSIARQEAMHALLAFSDLHGEIRSRRDATGRESDRDLYETERFILDEVLQLICERAQSITKADSVLVALAQPSELKQVEIVCRAAAGPLAVARGSRLIAESRFLQEALESGRILRCDDGEVDKRVELDFAHQIGARATILVPLRGRRQQLGVLQAFSTVARKFSDGDVRCLELLAELVLSALKPEDQDRRIHWLSDVVGDVLQPSKVEAIATSIPEPLPAISFVEPETIEIIKAIAEVSQAGTKPDAPIEPIVIPITVATVAESTQKQFSLPEQLILLPLEEVAVAVPLCDNVTEVERGEKASASERFLSPAPFRSGSRTGVNVVFALVAIAALFSAGAWWGVRSHQSSTPGIAATDVAESNQLPQSVTAPRPPRAEVPTPIVDNLMSQEKIGAVSGDPTPVSPNKLAALPKITGVRHWASSLGSTVVIDMEDQVPYEVHRLMSPERIYFDLHDTALSHELDGRTMDVGDVALSRVRVAQPVAGLTRIVLDTKDGANFSVSMETNPYRLVVELRGGDKVSPTNKSAASKNGPRAAASQDPAQKIGPVNATLSLAKATSELLAPKSPANAFPAKTGKFRIVLDAGHGGWDLGTVGRQGLLEKDLVLDVTERLGKLLQSRLGVDVLFTRDSDSYLPLDQRADLANQSQADLFVSIHANYSSSATARGVETYYTNLFAAPGSKEVEKHEDGSFTKLTPVSLSLGGLHQKIEESRKLAANVQHSLYATLAANSPDIRNRGIKDSAFVVLTGTTMPSILTEISFVSSPEDEHNLQSANYRQEIAEALYQGIAKYRQSSSHAGTHPKLAQLQTTAASR